MPRGSGLKIKTERDSLAMGGASRPVKKQPNRRGQTKPAASRVRQAFQSGVRMQPYSTAHRNE